MAIEIYAPTKPAIRHRALALSLALLLAVAALAGAMSWRRGDGLLAAPVGSPDFGASFRPPRNFSPGDPLPARFGSAYPFHGQTASGGIARLVVRRVEVASGVQAEAVCLEILRESRALVPFRGGWVGERSRAKIGALEGVEVRNRRSGTVVRATVLQNGPAYAVSLTVDDGPLDPRLYRLFDRTCRSFEFGSQ